MSELQNTLEEYWPVEKITLRCDDCEEIISTETRKSIAMDTASYMSTLLFVTMENHSKETEHYRFSLGVSDTKVLKSVDKTITIK